MQGLLTLLAHPLVRGALSGLVAAAVVDVHAFLRWRSAQDAATFDWKTAVLRWSQGAVSGALAAAGAVGVGWV